MSIGNIDFFQKNSIKHICLLCFQCYFTIFFVAYLWIFNVIVVFHVLLARWLQLQHAMLFSCFFVAFHHLHPGFSTIDYHTHMIYLNFYCFLSSNFLRGTHYCHTDCYFPAFLLLSALEFLARWLQLQHAVLFSYFFVASHHLHPGFSTIDYHTHMIYLNFLLLSLFQFLAETQSFTQFLYLLL